jgi:uncharacterized protein
MKHMTCPQCEPLGVSLQQTQRNGIEIDYCTQCKGVWLDRGELDKIIAQSTPAPEYREERREYKKYDDDDDRDRRHYDDDYKYKKKRGGLLGEIFDF